MKKTNKLQKALKCVADHLSLKHEFFKLLENCLSNSDYYDLINRYGFYQKNERCNDDEFYYIHPNLNQIIDQPFCCDNILYFNEKMLTHIKLFVKNVSCFYGSSLSKYLSFYYQSNLDKFVFDYFGFDLFYSHKQGYHVSGGASFLIKLLEKLLRKELNENDFKELRVKLKYNVKTLQRFKLMNNKKRSQDEINLLVEEYIKNYNLFLEVDDYSVMLGNCYLCPDNDAVMLSPNSK